MAKRTPMKTLLQLTTIACAAMATCSSSQAQTTAEAADPVIADAQRIEVTGHYDNALGSSDSASQGVIRAELLKSRPALRPGEVLEFVPGVIVTQHSGDGKANQYFLRGFNLDHGTDFATTVNGLPVNMPSNGHGQGYSDLNFLIPELVDRIEYRKGPYFARNGDFSSAGSADIVYRRQLEAPLGAVTIGEHGYRRVVLGGSGEVAANQSLLGALEVQNNEGPWTVPENLRKVNGVATYAIGTPQDGASISLMGYDAHWTSTDQVPESLSDAGTFLGQPFGRFDSLDPSDGGESSRYSLSADWRLPTENGHTHLSAYAMRYRLKLFSNFTYFLDNPVDGDQFSQTDSHSVYGLGAAHEWVHALGPFESRSEIGLQLRHDRVQVGLFNTREREILSTTREDEVEETSIGVYGQSAIEWTPWLRSVAGLRADHFRFNVNSLTLAANSGRTRDSLVSPKLAVVLGPWAKTEFFVNAGRGFHSNDARGTTARFDPKDPTTAVDSVPGLVASRGFELGMRTEAIDGLQTSLAAWRLDFDSELVYIGNAGATEASAPSRRYGIEWNNRYTPNGWLLFDADLAWTHARFKGEVDDRIPNSVDSVASVALSLKETGPWAATIGPWSGSLQWRYLGPGPLIEDNSVRSEPPSTFNLRIGRRLSKHAELSLDVFNLTDRKVNDIQYFYESRPDPNGKVIADRHVHPAEPRTARLTLRVTL
jgi:outer membrane receptor protein involved in Fe transport